MENLQIIENRIKQIAGHQKWYESKVHIKVMTNLLSERCVILNEAFNATAEEVARLDKINNLLGDMTRKMYRNCATTFRNLLKTGINEEYNDYNVEGKLFVCSDEDSILDMPDNYYRSDLGAILNIIDTYNYHKPHSLRHLESWSCSYNPEHKADITDRELHLINDLDDGQNWASGSMAHPKISHICICHAMYRLHEMHYSPPDILRLNSFWCEVSVANQYITIKQNEKHCF